MGTDADATDAFVAFLTARLSEDEATAWAADVKQGDPTWAAHHISWTHPAAYRVRTTRDARPIATTQDVAGHDGSGRAGTLDGQAVATHIATWDPARALATTNAHRAVLTRYTELRARDYTGDLDERVALRWVLNLTATTYAAHPDYDEGWRP